MEQHNFAQTFGNLQKIFDPYILRQISFVLNKNVESDSIDKRKPEGAFTFHRETHRYLEIVKWDNLWAS